MKPMTRFTTNIDAVTLIASLAGLLVGIGLTLSIVLGTHRLERFRSVPVPAGAASGYQQSALDPAADQSQVDAANMIRHDPVVQPATSAADDQLRVDAENMIRHDPPTQSTAGAEADQLRVDEENMIRRDPPLPDSNP